MHSSLTTLRSSCCRKSWRIIAWSRGMSWPSRGFKDIAYAQRKLKAAGLATVHVSERRDRPTVKALREFLRAREQTTKPSANKQSIAST